MGELDSLVAYIHPDDLYYLIDDLEGQGATIVDYYYHIVTLESLDSFFHFECTKIALYVSFFVED